MSGWTVVTFRGKENQEYDYSRYDDTCRGHARSDIAATMAEDDRVREFTVGERGHVYAYLACGRYDWDFAEDLMEDYAEMLDDAVVLGANDTTDTGCARYYERPDLGKWYDQYEESQSADGTFVGEFALRVISARHTILARDPFYGKMEWYDDEEVAENGESRLE